MLILSRNLKERDGRIMQTMCIAIVARKGGCGKTTTAVNLLAGMVSNHYEDENGEKVYPIKPNRVLLIDADPQANLTRQITGKRYDGKDATTIYEVLTGEVAPMDAINKGQLPHIIPSSQPKMDRIDVALADEIDKLYCMKNAVDEIKESGQYDVIIIDTPPSMSLATQSALCAADRVIITAKSDTFSMDSIAMINKTIKALKKHINPSIKTSGVLLTMYDDRAKFRRDAKETIQQIAENIGVKIFHRTIHTTVRVDESQVLHCSVLKHVPYNKAAIDYRNVALEFMMDEEIMPQTPYFEYDDRTLKDANKDIELAAKEAKDHE